MAELALFHYTCDHGRAALGTSGLVLPARQLTERALPWPSAFGWFTDLAVPEDHALGLTRYLVTCDRMAYRYRVTDDSDVLPWVQAARTIPRGRRDYLELEPGARPLHWWVAMVGVPVVLDNG